MYKKIATFLILITLLQQSHTAEREEPFKVQLKHFTKFAGESLYWNGIGFIALSHLTPQIIQSQQFNNYSDNFYEQPRYATETIKELSNLMHHIGTYCVVTGYILKLSVEENNHE